MAAFASQLCAPPSGKIRERFALHQTELQPLEIWWRWAKIEARLHWGARAAAPNLHVRLITSRWVRPGGLAMAQLDQHLHGLRNGWRKE